MSQAAGHRAKLITFEVGSRRMVMDDNIKNMKDSFQVSSKAMESVVADMVRAVILETQSLRSGALGMLPQTCLSHTLVLLTYYCCTINFIITFIDGIFCHVVSLCADVCL